MVKKPRVKTRETMGKMKRPVSLSMRERVNVFKVFVSLSCSSDPLCRYNNLNQSWWHRRPPWSGERSSRWGWSCRGRPWTPARCSLSPTWRRGLKIKLSVTKERDRANWNGERPYRFQKMTLNDSEWLLVTFGDCWPVSSTTAATSLPRRKRGSTVSSSWYCKFSLW